MKAMLNHEERLTPGSLSALRSLADAWDDAAGDQFHARQLAVTLSGLCRAGASEGDVRWLVTRRLATPLVELTRDGEEVRRFHEHPGLRFDERSCFVLTYAGRLFVEARELDRTNATLCDGAGCANGRAAGERLAWDRDCHELWLDGQVIKRYTQPAPCQWAILDAFQKASWPRRIAITLPTKNGRKAGRRLSEVVADLNRGLKGLPVRFLLDGSGAGVLCELGDPR